MCPDNALLSAYYDGEVSSPWKEQIEEHLESCEQCRAVLDQFAGQSRLLQDSPEPLFTSRYTELEHLIRQKKTIEVSSSVWSGMKRPVIPAAAAAAAVLAFFMGFMMARDSGSAGSVMTPVMAVSDGWSIPQGDMILPGEDFNTLLSLMDTADSHMFNQESSMELPVDLNLAVYGDSQLLKSADFTRSSSR